MTGDRRLAKSIDALRAAADGWRAKPTVTSQYLRATAEHYLIDDVFVWGLLRAAANTIDELEQWKTEAVQVITDWHSVWEAAGRPGRLGEPLSRGVAERLEQLEQRLAEKENQ